MSKIPKYSAELHALIWDQLAVPPSNRRAGDIKLYRLNDTWRAMSTIQSADPDFRNKVIAASILLSERYDLVD